MKARLGPIFMHFRPIPTMIRAKPSVMIVFSQVVSANVLRLIFNALARITYWLLMESEQSEQNCYIQYQTSSHVEAASLVTQPNCKLCFGRKSSNHLNSKRLFIGEGIFCARLLMGSGFEASNSRGKTSQAESVDFHGFSMLPCLSRCKILEDLHPPNQKGSEIESTRGHWWSPPHSFRCFPRNVQIHVLTIWYMCFIWIYIEILSCNNENLEK